MPFVARRVTVVTIHDPKSRDIYRQWRAHLANWQLGDPEGFAACECEAVCDLYDQIEQREQSEEERYAGSVS
jgi:hypothetical protein